MKISSSKSLPQRPSYLSVILNKTGMNSLSIGIIGSVFCWVFWMASPGMGGSVRIVQEVEVMGGLCTITAYGKDAEKTRIAVQRAFEKIRNLDYLMNHDNPNSLLSKVNQQGAMAPVYVTPELVEILSVSRRISEETEGAFDPTVGSLVKSWGFFQKEGRIPLEQERLKLMDAVGYQKLEVNVKKNRIRFKKKGMEIDLDAIKKGYALDQAAKILRQRGIEAALLDFQSVQLAIGHPPDKSHWFIRLHHPFDKKKVFRTMQLRDKALSISGDAGRFFDLAGKGYGQIFDPRTGRPVEGVAMTAVIAVSATEADAYSTASFVLGPEDGLHYLTEKKVEGMIASALPEHMDSPHLEVTAGWSAFIYKEENPWHEKRSVTSVQSRLPPSS